MSIVALFGVDSGEAILILSILLVLLGAKHLSDIAEGFGRGLQEVLRATRELSGRGSERPSKLQFSPPRH